MSMPVNPPPSPPPPLSPPRISYSGGQIAMLVIGGILLLPGLCAIVFAISVAKDISVTDPITQMIMVVWGICLAIAAVGVLLIVLARRAARRAS